MKSFGRLVFLFAVLALCGAMSFAQESIDETLDALLSDYVADDELGIVLYVRYGEDEWVGARGLANLDTGEGITTDSLFRIASASKPLVAAVLLGLVEAGEVNLDDPIANYVPDELAQDIPSLEDATVRQMLQMTSGIFNYTESEAFNDAVDADPSHMWTALETLAFIADEAPYFEPGTGYYYSNSNYTLAQVIIESGLPPVF